MYWDSKIVEGIQNDNLFEVMKDYIEEGRQLFHSRVVPELHGKSIYEKALVDMMLKPKSHVDSPIW